jgi:2-polyprenyl-3-methyl-5-hydroxy-6-metoxy-1,4-benzoquinol methylase
MNKFKYEQINIKQNKSESDSFTLNRYRHFLEHFPEGNLDILDVGCNTGRGGEILKKFNINLKITGLDCLKIRLDQLNPSIYTNVICSTTSKIPVPGNKFDVIVAGEFIEHLANEDVKSTLIEFHRILREDGLLMMTTPNPSGMILKLKRGSVIGGAHLSEHRHTDLKQTLINLNFSNIKVYGTGRVSKLVGNKLPIFFYNSYLIIAQKSTY